MRRAHLLPLKLPVATTRRVRHPDGMHAPRVRTPPMPVRPRPLRPACIGLGWLGLVLHFFPCARAQEIPRILPGSTAVGDGTFQFQFEAPPAPASRFQVQKALTLDPDAPWLPVEADLVALAAGIFQVRLPLQPDAAQAWIRIQQSTPPPPGPRIVLNEVMPDNDSLLLPAAPHTWDWIELYNPGDESVPLDGLRLQATAGTVRTWVLPPAHLAPRGRLLAFATDSTDGPTNTLVTGFTLSASGERLELLDSWDRTVDAVTVPPLTPNASYGRSPDGSETWVLFNQAQATPGDANLQVGTVQPQEPTFLTRGGWHSQPVEVRVETPPPGLTLRFTTDGSPATANAAPWPGSWPITNHTVLRVVAVDGAGNRSREVVRTFWIGTAPSLPVVSIATAPTNFTFVDGYLTGMTRSVVTAAGQVLANFPFEPSNAWRDREAPIHLEFLEPDGAVGLRQHAGMKVYGGWGSRGYPQKSYAFFARRSYGAGSFQHRLWPGLDLDSFESFVLRNSGNDNQSTHQTVPRPPITQLGPTQSWGSYFVQGNYTLLRDALVQELLAGTDLDRQAYRPVLLYVNGAYWGIHNLREKLTADHVLAHQELPEGAIDLIEGYGTVRAGDATAYRAMRDFLNTRGVATEANYRTVTDTWIDPDNLIDYSLMIIHGGNFDIGNVKCWRPRTPRGRFRWLVYDQDYAFDLWPTSVYPAAMKRDYADYANMFAFSTAGTGTSTGWPNAGGRTLILRRMLANATFRQRFIERLADLLNTAWRPPNVAATIDRLATPIRPHIPDHLQRWGWDRLVTEGFGLPHRREPTPFSLSQWEDNIRGLADFASNRPALLRSQCRAHFALSGGTGTLQTEVLPANAGAVRLNSTVTDSPVWTGIYFTHYPIRLRPVAAVGWRFSHWITASGTNTQPILDWIASPDTVHRIEARFEPIPSGQEPSRALWISEIQYHAPEDLPSGDWIEITNPGSTAANLDGWSILDPSNGRRTFLPQISLAAGARCVVARNRARFQWTHPHGIDPVTELAAGLDNGGETLQLLEPDGRIAFELTYDDRSPWPAEADGNGATLQYLRPELDPRNPLAWGASLTRGGTPGDGGR